MPRISRLLRDAGRRYYSLSGNELPLLLTTGGSAVVLEADTDLWGFAIAGWRTNHVTWLRCLTLAKGLETQVGIDKLIHHLHQALREQGVQHIFYAGDDTADTWLLPGLQHYGYVADTTVVVYEKHNVYIPTTGSESIAIRPARASDLHALVDLDSQCFESQWTMHESTFRAAMGEHAFFIVGHVNDQLVGYAYATSHFGGRLVHLVRIAVDPRQRRRGIGARLLAEVVTFARQQRADIITLNTQSYNERAQYLYRWFGFMPNGEYQMVLRYDL